MTSSGYNVVILNGPPSLEDPKGNTPWFIVHGANVPYPVCIRLAEAPDGTTVCTGLMIGVELEQTRRSKKHPVPRMEILPGGESAVGAQSLREIKLGEIIAEDMEYR